MGLERAWTLSSRSYSSGWGCGRILAFHKVLGLIDSNAGEKKCMLARSQSQKLGNKSLCLEANRGGFGECSFHSVAVINYPKAP